MISQLTRVAPDNNDRASHVQSFEAVFPGYLRRSKPYRDHFTLSILLAVLSDSVSDDPQHCGSVGEFGSDEAAKAPR